jgi:hypothetical protein
MVKKKADPTSAACGTNWPCVLDILQKGIWPFLTLLVSLMALYLNATNQRMQRENDGLREQVKAESQRANEAEQRVKALKKEQGKDNPDDK